MAANAKDQLTALRTLALKHEDRLAAVAAGLDPRRIIENLVMACAGNPYLVEKCDHASIFYATMQLSAIGLQLAPSLGHAAIVPYKGKGKAMPMVRGLITLAKRSEDLIAITPILVYEEDVFDVEYGSDPKIIHKPKLTAPRRDEGIVAVYSVSQHPSKHGGIARDFEVMTRAEVEEVRAVSQTAHDPNGPWVNWYGEQTKKTVLRRHTKRMDLSPEYRAAIELDNRAELDRVTALDPILDRLEALPEQIAVQTTEKTMELRERLAAARQQSKTPPATLAVPAPAAVPALPAPAAQPLNQRTAREREPARTRSRHP